MFRLLVTPPMKLENEHDAISIHRARRKGSTRQADHANSLPVARARDGTQGAGGSHVEYDGGSTTVHDPIEVTVVGSDVKCERRRGEHRRRREFLVWAGGVRGADGGINKLEI